MNHHIHDSLALVLIDHTIHLNHMNVSVKHMQIYLYEFP